MIEIYINSEWKYREVIDNIEALKDQYKGILASFSCYEIKDRIKFIRGTRDKIYSLQFEEWRRDKIWEYMNDFEELEVLLKLK